METFNTHLSCKHLVPLCPQHTQVPPQTIQMYTHKYFQITVYLCFVCDVFYDFNKGSDMLTGLIWPRIIPIPVSYIFK